MKTNFDYRIIHSLKDLPSPLYFFKKKRQFSSQIAFNTEIELEIPVIFKMKIDSAEATKLLLIIVNIDYDLNSKIMYGG